MKKLFTLCLLAAFCSGMHAQDVGLKLDQGRIVGLRDTINLCLRNGFYYRVLLPNGDTTDIAGINDLNNLNTTINASLGTLTPRFDSIKVAASNPSVGNIYVSSVDYRIHYRYGSYWYRLGVLDSAVIVSPLLANLAAYYKFDESTGNPADAKGVNNATSTYGVTAGVTGKFNTAFQFSGSNTQVQIPDVISNNVFSIGSWVYTSSATAQTVVCGQATGEPSFGITSTGALVLFSVSTSTVGTSTGAITYGAWNYVSVTFDGSGNYNFYINGSNVGSGNNPTTFTNLSTAYIIGGGANGKPMNGTIDEMAIYNNRVLTQSEIALLMNKTYPFN